MTVQMQDLMMGILVATSLVVLVLGVLSAWVMTSSQSRLLWWVPLQHLASNVLTKPRGHKTPHVGPHVGFMLGLMLASSGCPFFGILLISCNPVKVSSGTSLLVLYLTMLLTCRASQQVPSLRVQQVAAHQIRMTCSQAGVTGQHVA